jgi:phosphoribosylformylglycinamidine cyclo-ligase
VIGKLGRALKPSGFGAELYDLFDPPSIMKEVKELGGVSNEEAYKTWNMGNGFMVITPDPDIVLEQARKFNLNAREVGSVRSEKGIVLKTHTGEIISTQS